MLDLILLIDEKCFIIINKTLSNPIFDLIMPIFDNTKSFIPIMLFPFILAIIFDKRNRLQLALLIPIVIILIDQSGVLIKKLILRPRPWAVLESDQIFHLVSKKGKNYSFPSNHAANISGLAIVFSSIYSKYKYIFWTIAMTVIFSRVYIGVHYPLDVLVGWLLGSTYGLIVIKIWSYIKNKKN